jgi:Na+/H+-dicarboxylate symporter
MKTRGMSRTAGALVGLAAGIAVGILIHGSNDPWVLTLEQAVAVIGQLWVAVIRATVLPLVISLTLVAIVGAQGDSIGALGAKTFLLFVLMLFAAGLLTFAVGPAAISLYPVDAGTAASLRAGTSAPAAALEAARAEPASVGDWLLALVPTNLVRAAASGEILPLLLFTVFFALAVTRLAPEPRDLLRRVFQAFADAMMVLIGWILKALPLAVFALCLEFAFRAGVGITGVIGVWVALVSAMLILVTLLLYPVTVILGRVPLSRFARALAPAQAVAVSTRSSLASLPAMVEGGRKHLGLPASATGFVLPLSVAVFKLNMAISGPMKILFLAHVLQLNVGLHQLVAFLVTHVIISFSTVGIPAHGSLSSLPAYMAAGIPVEAVVILTAVDAIPDIFKTLANVTADMSAAAILSRRERAGPPDLDSELPRTKAAVN